MATLFTLAIKANIPNGATTYNNQTASRMLDPIAQQMGRTAPACPWSTPTSHDNVLQCNDGTYCNGLMDGWDCCNIHGMRKQCPKNYPAMCAKTNCAWGDYCCYTEDHCVSKLGGLRTCNATVNECVYVSGLDHPKNGRYTKSGNIYRNDYGNTVTVRPNANGCKISVEY